MATDPDIEARLAALEEHAHQHAMAIRLLLEQMEPARRAQIETQLAQYAAFRRTKQPPPQST